MRTRTIKNELIAILLLFSILSQQQTFAQTSFNSTTESKRIISVLSIDAGASVTSKTMQTNSMLGNGIAANINAYFPLWKIKTTPTFKATFGLNVGLGIQSLSNQTPKNNNSIAIINIQEQTSPPILSSNANNTKWKTSALPEAGIQVELSIHNFSITPILNLGYIKLKGNSYSVTQHTLINGKEQDKLIYSQNANDIKGLVVCPKLRLGYLFKNVGIYLEGSYLFVNSGSSSTTQFKPNGEPLKDGYYSVDQIVSGTYINNEGTKKFSNYGIKFGVSIPLGQTIQPSEKNPTNELTKGWDGSVKGNSKGINEAGIKKYEDEPNLNIVNGSDEPTTPQPQNQSIINTTKSNTKDYVVDLSNNPSTPQPNNAQDFNTCRSNRERGQLNTNPNDTTTSTNGNSDNNPTNELAKGWDGSVKGNSKGINEA
ncbi:MAG: hypothetical protein KDD21_08390, partial [Bacteroidetes bacterium]|nr:hypothetical protein [Bacteroidota bacterium]